MPAHQLLALDNDPYGSGLVRCSCGWTWQGPSVLARQREWERHRVRSAGRSRRRRR